MIDNGLFLNKIDPQIVKNIQKISSSGVVHKKEDVPIQRESKDKNESDHKKKQKNSKKAKEKVKALNDLAQKNSLDFFFVAEEEDHQLYIKVFDKQTNTCIRSFDENEIEELLSRLQDLSGIIVDTKR